MKYGNLPGIDKPISRLVQGTASLDTSDPEKCFELMDMAVASGITAFDHAHCYGRDKEVIIGKWFKSRGNRDKIVLLAKGAHPSDRDRVTPEDIEADMQESMKMMEEDYFDLYVLHRDDPKVPVGPIVEALNKHVQAGRIGAFGGSNWSYQRIAEANAYAKEHGLIPFSVSSPNFSLAEQDQPPWGECLTISGPNNAASRQYYAEHKDDIAIFPWSSLAGGFWSGRFTRDNYKESGDELVIRCYSTEANFERLDRVTTLGKIKGLTVAQVALAYVFSQGMNVFALTFCRNAEEFAANNAATDVQLTPQEAAWLDLRADSPA